MWKAFDRARWGIRLPRLRYSRLGATGVVSLITLGVIFLAGALLDLRADRADVRRFGQYAREARREPVRALVDAARTHRFLFLTDIPGAAEPKRLAAAAIEAIAAGPGLDAIIVDVGSDQQKYLDLYFNTEPEDASVLVSNPRTLHESASEEREFLDLYHRVWKLNEKLGPDRRIRVIAADLETWGDGSTIAPAALANRYAQRGRAMLDNLQSRVLALSSRARVFVFTTGLHALRAGHGQLQTGGTATVEVPWLAAQLAAIHPGEVYSAVVDAPGGASAPDFIMFRGTRVPAEAENELPGGRYALPIDQHFDFISSPIEVETTPGIRLDFVPRGLRLKDVADLYVHLGH